LEAIVDSREPPWIAELLRRICKAVDTRLLPVGDIIVHRDRCGVLVERKTVKDFFGSVWSGRLWEQMAKLASADEVAGVSIVRKILLVEGSFTQQAYMLDEPRKKLASISGALMECQFKYRIPVIQVDSAVMLEEFIRVLVSREEVGKNEGEPEERWFRPIRPTKVPERDVKVYVLSSIPFVGRKLATELLKEFGTIARIANASRHELMRVPGIGEKLATRIYRVFH